MNVQPSMDENENMEVLKLPEEITKRWADLKEQKEQKKGEIQKLKQRYTTASEKRSKMVERIEKIRKQLGSTDRGDVVGLRRKLEKIRAQNEVMQKL